MNLYSMKSSLIIPDIVCYCLTLNYRIEIYIDIFDLTSDNIDRELDC